MPLDSRPEVCPPFFAFHVAGQDRSHTDDTLLSDGLWCCLYVAISSGVRREYMHLVWS